MLDRLCSDCLGMAGAPGSNTQSEKDRSGLINDFVDCFSCSVLKNRPFVSPFPYFLGCKRNTAAVHLTFAAFRSLFLCQVPPPSAWTVAYPRRAEMRDSRHPDRRSPRPCQTNAPRPTMSEVA